MTMPTARARVIDQNGHPISPAYVIPYPIRLFHFDGNGTDRRGCVTLFQIDSGTHTFRIHAAGYRDATVEFPGRGREVTIPLAPAPQDRK